MNLVIFGAPGSGKGTQAEKLRDKLSLKHISTGDLLRDAVAKGTALGKKVEGILAAGELVSDDIVLELIRQSIVDYQDGWILDGFPRTVAQAEGLEAMLEYSGQDIGAVVVLDVDRDALISRLMSRARADDTEATISNRLDVYKQETMPILEYYQGKHTIHTVDGNAGIDGVTEAIERVLR